MKLTAADKKVLRELIRSHLDFTLRTLRERRDERFILRAERSLEDAEQLMRTSAKQLPPRSRNALTDRVYDVRKKLEIAAAEWEQHKRDCVRVSS